MIEKRKNKLRKEKTVDEAYKTPPVVRKRELTNHWKTFLSTMATSGYRQRGTIRFELRSSRDWLSFSLHLSSRTYSIPTIATLRIWPRLCREQSTTQKLHPSTTCVSPSSVTQATNRSGTSFWQRGRHSTGAQCLALWTSVVDRTLFLLWQLQAMYAYLAESLADTRDLGCYAFFCPCCFGCRLFKRAGENMCTCLCPSALYALRSKIRTAFRIEVRPWASLVDEWNRSILSLLHCLGGFMQRLLLDYVLSLLCLDSNDEWTWPARHLNTDQAFTDSELSFFLSFSCLLQQTRRDIEHSCPFVSNKVTMEISLVLLILIRIKRRIPMYFIEERQNK